MQNDITSGKENGNQYPMCSASSKALGEDLIASTPLWDQCLVLELAPPWDRDVAESPHFPAAVSEAMSQAQTQGLRTRIQCILPDPKYSVEGHARLLFLRRPQGPSAGYARSEYLVPDDVAGKAAAALVAEPNGTERFDRYRQDGAAPRDILVCTHGSRDACCAKFGWSIYRRLRNRYGDAPDGNVRVWRVSHTGGHRFAPTLIDLPGGHYWGRLSEEAVDSVMLRQGPLSLVADHYRGWAAAGSGFEQVAERAAFMREGWSWTGYDKESRLLDLDEETGRAKVRIEFTAPGASHANAYEIAVERTDSVPTVACMAAGYKEDSPQYRVESVARVA